MMKSKSGPAKVACPYCTRKVHTKRDLHGKPEKIEMCATCKTLGPEKSFRQFLEISGYGQLANFEIKDIGAVKKRLREIKKKHYPITANKRERENPVQLNLSGGQNGSR